jgi:hypothetical protein
VSTLDAGSGDSGSSRTDIARLQAMTKTVFSAFTRGHAAIRLYVRESLTTNAVIATKARSDTPSRAGVLG